VRVAACQLNSGPDKDLNIKAAFDVASRAARAGADLVVLPEYTDYLGPGAGAFAAAEEPQGPAHTAFADAARELGVWLLVGSIRVKAPDGRVYNTSLVFDRSGQLTATYRKVHLFDVDLPDRVTHKESDTVAPGDRLVQVDVDQTRVGLSICYDLRFPELYRAHALAGAHLLAVPAAFTFFTGRDHWEVLLRARAIENQCYVVAAGQYGTYPPDGHSNGRSMIIDPWGVVVACAPDEPGFVTADLDRARIDRIRTELPSLANRRTDAYPAG
jgi:deaminated glutathione amidase